ncbi:MAG: restriction endonuclease subunit S [Hyphomicrobiales bacterium]
MSMLRRFLFDLAMEGRLAEQRDDEEPARDLLARITAIKGKTTAKRRELSSNVEQPPYSLPEAWVWTTLAEVGFRSPRNVAPVDHAASFVPMPSISAEYGVPIQHEVRSWGEIKKGYTHFAEGDVGVAKITPCFENGKSAVFRGLTGGIGSGTTELHVIRPVLVNPDFILIFLKSPRFIEGGIPKMTGTAGQKRLPSEYFAGRPFPLPPLAEQARIVSKVGELMALCDQLEAAQKERELQRDALRSVSLHRLTSTDVVANEATDVQFFLKKSPRLITKPEHVGAVRQSILDLAVQGRLVPQDPRDEAAVLWLRRATSPRPEVHGVRITRTAFQPETNPTPWSPSAPGWLPVTLDDVASLVTSGSRGWAQFYSSEGALFVRSQNVKYGRLLLDDRVFVSPPKGSEGTRTSIAVGDLLVVITGDVGHVGVWERDLGESYVSQHLALVKPISPDLSPWLLLCLMAPTSGRRQLRSSIYGGKPGLNLTQVRSIGVPLPPLAEQRRIVAKVAELMAVCDELEAALAAAQYERGRLLKAMLHDVLDQTARPIAATEGVSRAI